MNIRVVSLLGGVALMTLAAAPAAAEEKSWSLTGFEGVGVSAGIHAEITVGPDYSIRAVGDPRQIETLRIELDGASLDIGRERRGFSWGQRGPLAVYVTLPELKVLDVSSGAHAETAGVKGGPFSIETSSGGHAEVSGVCDALAVDVSSGGHIEARNLKCKTASANASSGGHSEIFVSESLTADASSGGHIEVYGAPKNVNKDESSGGDVSIED
jgi:hypothetical protein